MYSTWKTRADKVTELVFVDFILSKIYYSLVTNTRDLDFLFLLYFVSVIDLFQAIISPISNQVKLVLIRGRKFEMLPPILKYLFLCLDKV